MVGEQDDSTFIPQVTVNAIPKAGQEFQSLEDALSFYNDYARQAGFSTRVANNKKDKETGEDVWKMISCSKEGKTDESWQNKHKNIVARSGERNRGHTRCGCKAKMTVKKSHDRNVWVVGYFIEQHNHALSTPSKVHLLKSHRNVSAAKKALVQKFSEANIPTCQQVRLLEIDAGGPSFIGCVERDLRNHKRDIESELCGHDAESLIQYFESEKEKNDNFYYVYETNDSGIFVRCFWVDCESRRSYAQFGDVVVLDTTYNTNKYRMIFAPFVGVNHHRQTTVFGCGLLSDEKTESFIWLFSKFLECMSNHPGVIITDQDAAISGAVLEVFPNVVHRFCLWHILNKFPEKMNDMLYREQYHKLVHIIKESESSEEFEHRWMELIESTELKSNEWLSNLYTIRHQWVPTYVKHVFATGMSSSQRAESNHSFYKRYVNRKNSLVDFIMRFNRALVHQRHEELVANHTDLNEKPRMVTGFLMESQMASVYTKTIFLQFQKELQQSMLYICTLLSSTNVSSKYTVKRFESGQIFHRERELTYYTSSDLISCSCRLFEFEGYACHHMLCWMKVQQIMILPEKYIIQRWTKEAKSTIIYEPTHNFVEGQSLTSRHGALSHMSMDLVDKCSLTEASSNFLMAELQKLKSKVKDFDIGGNTNKRVNESGMHEVAQTVQDPNLVRAKGCRKRMKSSKEKAMSQSNRSCSICNRSGHDKRTCPELPPISHSIGEACHPEYSRDNTLDGHSRLN